LKDEKRVETEISHMGQPTTTALRFADERRDSDRSIRFVRLFYTRARFTSAR